MERNDNKTDRYFRDRLENLEQSPPDATWELITNKMDSRRKKRAALIFLRIAAGMAFLISTGIGIYYISNLQSTRTTTITQSSSTKQHTENEINNTDAPSVQNDKNITSRKAISNSVVSETSEIAEQASKPEKRLTEPERTVSGDEPGNADLPELIITPAEPGIAENTISEISGNQNVLAETIVNDHESKPAIVQPADTMITPGQATAILLAQNEVLTEDPPVKTRKWTIGSEIAPLYTDRNINAQGNSDAINDLNSSETGVLAYAGGVRVGINAGKRVKIQSGIYYSRYGQQINDVQVISAAGESAESYKFIAASNSTGNIEGVLSAQSEVFIDYNYPSFYETDMRNGITNSELKPLVQSDVTDVELKQIFNYFELPLIVSYKVIDRKIDFSFSGGLITNFMVGNSVSLIADGESKSIGETTGLNEINYLGSFGMGLEMPVSGNFSLSLEPRFRYYLSPIDRSENISVHPYSFGFFAGVNYRF